MQKNRRRLFALGLTLSLVPVAFNAAHSQPFSKGRIRVYNGLRGVDEKGAFLRITTFVTLFKDGAMVRSSDLTNSPNNASGSLDWSNLPLGDYEVHFQIKGYGTIIKKVALNSDLMSQVNLEKVGRNDEVWDGGPTVFQMEAQISTLQQKENDLEMQLATAQKKDADLEARLAAVEKGLKK